jgi:SAM-dependent methyltransferase
MNKTLCAENFVENHIQDLLKSGNHVRVLEVGCGEGRVLMELRKIFPAIELHGINKEPWPAMRGSKSLLRTGLLYRIFTRREMRQVELPGVTFGDARKIGFPDDYFDLVISQVSVPFVERKDLLLEEVWRVLRPGGMALLHLDHVPPVKPDFFLTETPRFLIYSDRRLVGFADHAARYKAAGYFLECKTRERAPEGSWTILEMRKTQGDLLNLGLSFDALSSFRLELLAEENPAPGCYYGYRSVYSSDAS